MKNFPLSLFGLFCTAILVVPLAAFAQPSPTGGAWLDKLPVDNWNQPGIAIPKAKTGDLTALAGRCKSTIRQAATPEDRAVTAAGWILYAPYQLFSGTSVVSGLSAVDGMCRPLGYQEFVFVDGKFVGTLSPTPMNSRTDGALNRKYLSATGISAEFSRYTEGEPLCCPSKTTTVIYKIQRQKNLPVVVPVNVTTNPNSQQ